MSKQPRKLKTAVIKEELVILLGHYIQALILNQFLYWSERTRDTDRFIEEEKHRDTSLEIEPTYGWIYKTSEKLNDELMLDMSPSTIRRHLIKIISAGYIDQRNNPKYKWDRTLQYRPNIIRIQTDLHKLGYALRDYPLVVKNAFSIMKNGKSEIENGTRDNEKTIPKTTLKITSKSSSENQKTDSTNKTPNEESTSFRPQKHWEVFNPITDTDNDLSDDINDWLPTPPTEYPPTEQLTDDERRLAALGINSNDTDVTRMISQMRKEGWEIKQSEIEECVSLFLITTGWDIPASDRNRKLWIAGIRDHIQEYGASELKELYARAWPEIKDAILKDGMSLTHPRATSFKLAEIQQRQTMQGNGSHVDDPNIRLSQLRADGHIVTEIKGDYVEYYWAKSHNVVSKNLTDEEVKREIP